MYLTRRVASDVWLAITTPQHMVTSQLHGLDRRQADTAAGHRALGRALEACQHRAGPIAQSLSHTRGFGAALVGPASFRLGVDLVEIDRVGLRHARAVLTSDEWEELRLTQSQRPALAWGLKESAAKATGDPVHFFPDCLRLERHIGRLVVRVLDGPASETLFDTGWGRIGPLLCVWAIENCEESKSGGQTA